MTITDNWQGFVGVAGGDRVGLGGIAFAAVPEPSLLSLGMLALAFRRRCRREETVGFPFPHLPGGAGAYSPGYHAAHGRHQD